MLPAIEGLLVLQERDRRISELKDLIARLPDDEARARSRLSKDEAAVAEAKAAVQRNGVGAKNVELDMETRQNTIGRLKQQQFETRKNEEFQALGHEVERYSAEVDTLETRLLEFMEKDDELRNQLKAAETSLQKSQQVVEDDLKGIASRAENFKKELAEVEADRSKLTDNVEEELLELYERLLVKKNGLAVASVRGGQCGGCHVKLVPATLIKVQAESQIVQCENCGRILYPDSSSGSY